MNQNFTFMRKLAPMVFERKQVTNRKYTPYRAKCKRGDIMHCFTGLRGPDCQKLGDGIILDQEYWENGQIPDFKKTNTSPLSYFTLEEFVYLDGFDSIEDFETYFMKKNYDDGILCYYFKKIE